jgi:hypothetical protein
MTGAGPEEAIPATALRFGRDGAQVFAGALSQADVADLLRQLGDQPTDRAGVRLFNMNGLTALLGIGGPVGRIAASLMPGEPRPVRALLFDKTASSNWALAWRQDRVIAVHERVDVSGFGPWTRKGGALHVAPPPDVHARMITLRAHLDPVPATNGPLLIAPRSHRLGRIAERDVRGVVQRLGVARCLAEPGDIWAYATPILHASERATAPARRRVLHVDYAAEDLPGGLQWLGV